MSAADAEFEDVYEDITDDRPNAFAGGEDAVALAAEATYIYEEEVSPSAKPQSVVQGRGTPSSEAAPTNDVEVAEPSPSAQPPTSTASAAPARVVEGSPTPSAQAAEAATVTARAAEAATVTAKARIDDHEEEAASATQVPKAAASSSAKAQTEGSGATTTPAAAAASVSPKPAEEPSKTQSPTPSTAATRSVTPSTSVTRSVTPSTSPSQSIQPKPSTIIANIDFRLDGLQIVYYRQQAISCLFRSLFMRSLRIPRDVEANWGMVVFTRICDADSGLCDAENPLRVNGCSALQVIKDSARRLEAYDARALTGFDISAPNVTMGIKVELPVELAEGLLASPSPVVRDRRQLLDLSSLSLTSVVQTSITSLAAPNNPVVASTVNQVVSQAAVIKASDPSLPAPPASIAVGSVSVSVIAPALPSPAAAADDGLTMNQKAGLIAGFLVPGGIILLAVLLMALIKRDKKKAAKKNKHPKNSQVAPHSEVEAPMVGGTQV